MPLAAPQRQRLGSRDALTRSHLTDSGLGRSVVPNPLRQNRLPRFELLLLVVGLLSLLPFVPSLGGPFFWDDNDLILNNPFVRSFSYASRWLTHSYFDTGQPLSNGQATYFRPLALGSFALDWAWGNGNPTAFHVSNLVLYAATSMAIVTALKRWSAQTGGALLVGLLLAWHPTKAESVAWISGRTDILVTLFILLACHSRALSWKNRSLGLTLELVATLGAYTSKETAIVLPVFIALESWVHANRPSITWKSTRAVLRASFGQIVVACLYLVARAQWLSVTRNSLQASTPLHFVSHIGLVLQTLGRAVELALLPLTQRGQHGLVSLNHQGGLLIHPVYALLGAVALVFVAGLAIAARRQLPLVTWGCVVLVVTWLPTSHVVPTHLACDLFERFLFLPSLGLALILLAFWPKISSLAHARIYLAAPAVALLGLGALRSYDRSLDYADPHRFWEHELRVNPLSVVAPVGLLASRIEPMPVKAALNLLDRCYRNGSTRRQTAEAVGCAFEAATYIADYSADLDRATQASGTEFFRAVADAVPRKVQLSNSWATLSVDLSNPDIREALERHRGEALAILADLESRQRDSHAIVDARKALAGCERCRYVPRAAKALSSFGLIQESLTALEPLSGTSKGARAEVTRQQILQTALWQRKVEGLSGPEKLHAEAQAFLSIGLYGAAYELLAPHRAEFEGIPEVAKDYARMAANAGNADEAKDILRTLMPPNEVTELIDKWQKQRNLVYPN